MSEALKVFNESIKYCLFFIASNKEEEKKVKEIVYICAEYIYLARLNKLSEQLKEKDKVKYAETVCVMSSCNLENPIHKFLIYKKAKVCCKNIKNFITALSFIKKMFLLEKDVKLFQ